MPELPEVETVRRTLAEQIVGRRVQAVKVYRRDVVRGPTTLLRGQRITEVRRLGKQLALVGETKPSKIIEKSSGSGACVCVHLGMSGSLRVGETLGEFSRGTPGKAPGGTPGGRHPGTEVPGPQGRVSGPRGKVTRPWGRVVKSRGELVGVGANHVHVVWRLEGDVTLWFRDPRRFGGIWMFSSVEELEKQRWQRLGPDALFITPTQLLTGLGQTRRALKAALLDQHLVAGLGNIYVDELLFATKLHPLLRADAVDLDSAQRLVRVMRRLLGRAIDAGGTTLRDYVDATGQPGGFQTHHRVYGRGGQPCGACGRPLETLVVAGRTTTACEACQPCPMGARVSRE